MNSIPLSEAIKLGAMLHPQAFGAYANVYLGRVQLMGETIGFVEVQATCALGAALEAAGKLEIHGEIWQQGDIWQQFQFPELEVVGVCPDCKARGKLGQLIPHLNDTHRWTRERIAGWVDEVVSKVAEVRQETCAR